MSFTLRIQELYQNCVKARLEVKLNLWSREGNEYFFFTKSMEF